MTEMNRLRLRWRCRRGMLELDLLLERFLEQRYPALTAEEREIFQGMLECPDAELWDMVNGRAGPPSPCCGHILALLRAG